MISIPRRNNSSLQKISKLEDPSQYSRLGLVPRRADLDMNQHVNNVTYIGWVLEELLGHPVPHYLICMGSKSMPQEIIDTHELQTITLDYRRECQHDDIVDSLTSSESTEDAKTIPELRGTNGSATATKGQQDCCQFLHLLRLSGEGLEINRGRTEWRKKTAR
ncbi:Oleoyl-acyl carrier protein thioesterase, chloroplastic [Vitis vinifera]|uniref:Oleoyl-acyl carrier protein thioesterase, chloroplastic n=1 Tax=Vitis vinifera TaxID=29760 RepID=A0A438CE00_VITVI|nr:Oleoyl-acyl carrier protein thioesterase, chloroplastic [Vitis vinifera]